MQSYTQFINASYTHSIVRYAKDAAQVITGSLFLALAAQISIPFLPVPLTMQTFVVMALGLCLGSVKGTLSVVAYLIESMLGLPVLTQMAIAPLAIIGIRGGYLFGFVIQAYLVGRLFEKYSTEAYYKLLTALLFISMLQLGLGTLWLGNFIGWKAALTAGFYPFIIGEVVKCVAILGAARRKLHS